MDQDTTPTFIDVAKLKESRRVPRIDTSGVIAVARDRRRFPRRARQAVSDRTVISRRVLPADRRLKDRRGFERIFIDVPIEERVGKSSCYRISSDLSVLGVSFERAIPHPKGTKVQLRFTLPDGHEDKLIKTYGKVLSPLGDGTGMRIQFVGLHANHAKRIGRFIAAAMRRATRQVK